MMTKAAWPQHRSNQRCPLALGEITVVAVLSPPVASHKEGAAAATAIRSVRTVAVEMHEGGEKLSLTGEIQPRYQADIGFGVNCKIPQRAVDVETPVSKGDLRFDPQQYRQDLEVAKSEVASGRGRGYAKGVGYGVAADVAVGTAAGAD